MNQTTEIIFDKLFSESHIPSNDNIIVVTGDSDERQMKTLSFILGLI